MHLFAHFPDATEVRHDVADYYWEVQRFDREVGELLATIEELQASIAAYEQSGAIELIDQALQNYQELITLLTTFRTAVELAARYINDRKLPAKMVMTPVDEPGNQTIIEVLDSEYNIDIDGQSYNSLEAASSPGR